MPYSIRPAGGDFEVVNDDSGKVMGKHPTRKQALEQQRALYANVPEASGKASADVNNLPDSAFLFVESGGEKDDTKRTVPRTLRHLPYRTESGDVDLPKLRNALSRLGQSATGESGGDKWLTSKLRDELRAKAEKILAAENDKTEGKEAKLFATPTPNELATETFITRLISAVRGIALKGDVVGHEFHGNQYTDSSSDGSESSQEGKIKKRIEDIQKKRAQLKKDDPNNPEIDDLAIEIGKHQYELDQLAYQKQPRIRSSGGVLYGRGAESLTKEGRRNSMPDEARLQQIHDLSVANGAQCAPFVFKEASGRLRWVMLSSNSFQDTDREIVSQAALERDVERSDKEKNYGPLRWWHVGDPDKITRSPGNGIDIGDCDFRAMHGRVLIESGTFRNNRIGEAIKERADTLAGSIGFFHPSDEPNSEGVFTEIHTFERSLLPRGRASNPLTALTVTKEGQDMATMKEKFDDFVALLGGDQELAQSVVNKAEQTEKEASERGLKFKEGETITATAPAVVVAEKADKADPKAEVKPEEDAEEKPEKKADAEPDFEKLAKGLKPHIDKMIEEKMADAKKERTEKEAGLTAQIDALKVQLKEAQTALNTLAGDLPRGVKNGYRASQAESTVNPDKPVLTTKEDRSPIGTIYDWLVAPTQGQG